MAADANVIRTEQSNGYFYEFVGDGKSINARIYRKEGENRQDIRTITEKKIKLNFPVDENSIHEAEDTRPTTIMLNSLPEYETRIAMIRGNIEQVGHDILVETVSVVFSKQAHLKT